LRRALTDDILTLIRAEEEKETSLLSIFSYDRSIAMQSALILFEIAVADVAVEDERMDRRNEERLLPMGQMANQFYNAICDVIPEIWQRCTYAGTFNTEISQSSFQAALDAFNLERRVFHLETGLEYSRYNQMSIVRDGNRFKISPMKEIKEWGPDLIRRNARLDASLHGSAYLEVAATRPPGTARPLDFLREMTALYRRLHGFELTTDLGSYTAGEYEAFWTAMLDIIMSRVGQNINSIRGADRNRTYNPREFVLFYKVDHLVEVVSQKSLIPIEKVEIMINQLMFRGKRHQSSVFLFPVVPIGSDFVCLSPTLFFGSEPFRNLRQRLVILNSTRYSKLQAEISTHFVNNVSVMFGQNGFQVMMGKKVRSESGIVATDIDILAIKNDDVFILQVKNMNPPDTAQENARADEEAQKASEQLETSVIFVQANVGKMINRLNLGRNVDLNKIRYHPYVVTGVKLHVPVSGPKWKFVTFQELEEIVSQMGAVGELPKEESVQPPKRGVGKFAVGPLEFELSILLSGADEGAVLDLSKFERLDDLLTHARF
jgi:hypothetical protein